MSEGECSGNGGVITGVYFGGRYFGAFSPSLAINEEVVVREDFIMQHDGKRVKSPAAKLYLWRKHLAWEAQLEQWREWERNRQRREDELEEQIALDAVMEYRRTHPRLA